MRRLPAEEREAIKAAKEQEARERQERNSVAAKEAKAAAKEAAAQERKADKARAAAAALVESGLSPPGGQERRTAQPCSPLPRAPGLRYTCPCAQSSVASSVVASGGTGQLASL